MTIRKQAEILAAVIITTFVVCFLFIIYQAAKIETANPPKPDECTMFRQEAHTAPWWHHNYPSQEKAA